MGTITVYLQLKIPNVENIGTFHGKKNKIIKRKSKLSNIPVLFNKPIQRRHRLNVNEGPVEMTTEKKKLALTSRNSK